MITFYIWARDAQEAIEETHLGFGNRFYHRIIAIEHKETDKLYEVTINAKEIS
jgi:hypothetical protein